MLIPFILWQWCGFFDGIDEIVCRLYVDCVSIVLLGFGGLLGLLGLLSLLNLLFVMLSCLQLLRGSHSAP